MRIKIVTLKQDFHCSICPEELKKGQEVQSMYGKNRACLSHSKEEITEALRKYRPGIGNIYSSVQYSEQEFGEVIRNRVLGS